MSCCGISLRYLVCGNHTQWHDLLFYSGVITYSYKVSHMDWDKNEWVMWPFYEKNMANSWFISVSIYMKYPVCRSGLSSVLNFWFFPHFYVIPLIFIRGISYAWVWDTSNRIHQKLYVMHLIIFENKYLFDTLHEIIFDEISELMQCPNFLFFKYIVSDVYTVYFIRGTIT